MGSCSSKATESEKTCSTGSEFPSSKTTGRYSLKHTEASSYFLSTNLAAEHNRKRAAKPRQLEKIAAARVQLSQLPEASLTVREGYTVGSVERWKAHTTQHLFVDPREEMIIEETAFSLDTGSGSMTVPFASTAQEVMYGAASTVESSLSKSSWTTTTREARLEPPRIMAGEEDLHAVRAKNNPRKAPKRRSARRPDDASLERQQHGEEDHLQTSTMYPEKSKVEMDNDHDSNSRGRARHKRRSLKFTQEFEEDEQVNTLDDVNHPIPHMTSETEIDSSKGTTTMTSRQSTGSNPVVLQAQNEMAQIDATEACAAAGQNHIEQRIGKSEHCELDVVQLPQESSPQARQSEEHHVRTHPDTTPTTPIPDNPKPKVNVASSATNVITPTEEGQIIHSGQAHEITPKTARTSNRKVGSKSPRRFGGPENLPLVSPKLIARRVQGTSRQSPRVHRLRVTPKGMKKDGVSRPSLLPPSGLVARDDGKFVMTPLETSGSSTLRNSLQSMALNVPSPGMPPFATDLDCDTNHETAPSDGPLSFPDDSNPAFLRLCNKLRKKLNLDPWDEFKRFDDEEFTDFVQTYPQTCRVRYSFDNFTGKLLPFSIVCTMGANVETVRATWEAFPPALLECDDWIGTPLHYACSYQAKKSVVKFLIQQDCTMLERINQFGRTPLHMACLFKAPVQTIYPLIEVFPHAVEVLDKDGYSPLHLACENGSSLEVIQALLEISPKDNGLVGTSEKDLTPLHIACASNAPKAVIQALINHCPDAADQLDQDGQLPLHHAVHASVSQAVIELLVHTFPRSVEVPNGRGQTAYRIAKRKHMPETVLDILDEEIGEENDAMQVP